MTTFRTIGINKELVKGLKELGIVQPTEIQERTIPILLEKKTDLRHLY